MKKPIVFLMATAIMFISLSVTSLAASGTTSGSTSSIPTSSNSTGTSADTSTAKSAVTSPGNETYKVTSELLNVRSGPSATDAKLGSLTKGETVTGTVSNGWLSFKFNGKDAYCYAKCLAKVVKASSTGKSYTVTATKLHVRSGPGTTYSELGNLSKGDTVTGTVSNGWLSFTYNGKAAYCNATCLK